MLKSLRKILSSEKHTPEDKDEKVVFTNSSEYWDERYKKGGNSGAGSYSHFAEFKAEVINALISKQKIGSVIELGCGDGNQLRYFDFDSYLGFDISPESVAMCREKFKEDPSKSFKLMSDYSGDTAELVMSLDVIFHLVEDEVFESYIQTLFEASEKYVIVYSSNRDDMPQTDPHVKHRKFTDWVKENLTEFELVEHIPNKYPYDGDYNKTSFADFYIFQKKEHS